MMNPSKACYLSSHINKSCIKIHIRKQYTNSNKKKYKPKTKKMGCINDKPPKTNKIRKQQFQNKYHHSANPIIQIAKEWNVDIIRERWHDNELDVVRAKLGPKVDRITKEQFVRLIPGMGNFAQASQDNFYELFNYEENQVLSVNNFVTSQIILLKSDDYDLLADMFFFAYSTAPNKTHLTTKDYISFTNQFKQHQLQFMHQTVKPQKDQNGQMVIKKNLFRQIFEQYDIKTIKQLFKFSLKEEEKRLQKYLSTYGVDRVNGAQVFVVDFQWFLKWKNYMEHKYGIKVEVKENGKQLGEEKTSFMLSTFKTKDKWLKAGEKLTSESQESYMEPVNNQRIQGEEFNELRQGLLEFSDFISVPSQLWSHLRIIYGGGPAIDKPFPYYYNKRIILIMLNQSKCEFIPGFWKALVYNPNETFQQIYENRQQRYFLKDSVEDMVVYYKHPGELEWKKIADLDKKLENFPFQYKSYVVYVRSEAAKRFQDKFNLTEVKGKKQIKQRVKNYGNLLNFQHEAILQQGYVGGIFSNTAVLYLKSSKGQYMKIQSKISDLQKINPHVLQQNFMQGFAGLQNIGNTCYMNAPLQCLLKTPYFDEYMDSVNLDRGRKDMLTYQLQDIHEKSRNSRDCVSMGNFKKRFDEKFPFFEGTAQHDAQEFLLLLLDKLSEEQPRQSLINVTQETKKNKKIHTFFSGLTRSQTQCLACHKKGRTQQSFFTYSLSLPIIKQALLKFYFVDENFIVKKYGLTIEKDCQVGQVVRMIESEVKADQELIMVSACEGEWMNDVRKLSPTYKVSKLQNYDSAIVCYPVKYKETPDYEDLVQGKTKNSIKIQVRNRVYDQKKKTYKPFHFPFCLEVNHETTGKSLAYTIIDKIKKFINDEDYHLFKEFEEEFEDEYVKLLATNLNNKEKKKQSDIKQEEIEQGQKKQNKNKTSREKLKDLPFTIQYLRKQDGMRSVCWFCKKNIDHSTKKAEQQTNCQGCKFKDTQRLYESRSFMKGFNSLLIAIDWRSCLFSKDWTTEETRSYKQALKQQNERKSHLTNLLKQATEQQQSIQLKCQKPSCESKEALRKQFIIEAPNILILHLKRFYYKENTFHKLKNKVVIPEEFELPRFSDKYELYGNVVHYGSGSGRGGHYVNYVKVNGRWYRCDDEKVHFTKDPNEHLNPDTYLLFYKRQRIDKSWTFFGF